jgi:glycosyltransferase involved in cell wall biosynthesis
MAVSSGIAAGVEAELLLKGKPGRMKFSNHQPAKTVLMLLTNAYDPDPRVRQEALALIGMGCRVKLLAWDRDLKAPAWECMEGVEVERVFVSSRHGRGTTQLFFYAWVYLKLLWRGWRSSFDVVHCHDLDTLPLGFLLGKLKRKPIVYDAHESFPDMVEGSVHPQVRNGLTRLENFFIRRIDLLITVGEKLRHHFDARGCRHSVVVGNWKRLEDFSRSEQQNLEVRRCLGIPTGALVVACITQLLKDRQIEELLQAVADRPNVYVIVGGRGVLQAMVEQAAASNPRILFVGFVSGKQIADYTCAADVVYYGFDPHNPNARFSAPNKLYEALAAGRPLITGDFGEIADVVRDAECGIVLPEYSVQAIQKALDYFAEANVRNSMAACALRFGAASMNWEKGAEALHREYSRFLAGLRNPSVYSRAETLSALGMGK